MRKYLIEAKLVEKYEVPERLINMYFGRPYWDLTTVKGGASKTPGFRERDFDALYSIRGNYSKDGKVTGYTPTTVMKGLQIVKAQEKIVEEFNKNINNHFKKCQRIYYEFDALLEEEMELEELEKRWIELIDTHYFESETTYFWLIYTNTIEQSINKNYFLKYVDEMEYLSLLGGMDDISHMRPFRFIWEMSREYAYSPSLEKAVFAISFTLIAARRTISYSV
jgi:pyruvate,water dikinase